MATAFPFTTDPQLTGVVVAYQNAELIADRVFPRIGPLQPQQEFRWLKFDFAQGITVPDTKVGRKGTPNEVEFSSSEQSGHTTDYGLSDVVPNDDIKNAPKGYDPLAFAAQKTMDLVLLDREVRCATKAFDANNYATANKTTLSGTSQWSHASSDPLGAIMDAKDGMVMAPNKLVIGRPVWSKLRRHPALLAALSISGTDKGRITLQQAAEYLELDEIIVGSAWVNTARKGQAATLARAWGKHALLFRQDKLAKSIDTPPTFAWTAEYGGKVATQLPEPKVGLRGAVRVTAGESVAEIISAADLAFFFQNAVA